MRVMPLEIEHPERIGLLLDFGNCRKQKTNSIVQGLPWGVRPGSTPWKFVEMRKSSGVLSQTDSGSGGYRKARPRECEQNIVLEKTAAEQNVRKSWGRSWLGNENLRHSGKGGRASVFSTQFPDF